MIDQIILYIQQWIAWISERTIAWLSAIINNLLAWLNSAFQDVLNWFVQVFEAIFNYISAVVEQITSFFTRALDEIYNFVQGVWTKFLELTTTVINSVQAFVSNAWSEVRTAIQSILDDAMQWMRRVADEVVRLINVGIDSVLSIAESVERTLTSWLDVVLQRIADTYNNMIAGFNRALEMFLGGAGSFIAAIESRLSDLKIAFADAATDIVAGITETAEETLGPIRDKIKLLIEQMVPEGNAVEAQSFVVEARKLSSANATPAEMRKFASDIWMKTDFKDGIWAQIFFTIIGVMGGVALIAQVTSLSAQVMMQDFAKAYPFQLFTPGDVTQAWRRELVSESFAADTIQRAGYTAENAKLILKLSDQVPNEGDLLILYHRGLIDEAALDKALHQRGYDQFYKERMKKASFLIPPINDLITMAVREAFSPEIAERFGQYEDFPKLMVPWAEKQALSEEWSRRYWAAHWALPSPQQGFEMLHRGVIEQSDLDLLLRALDVMPFWRERLVKIAYTPFTRIDIRRMHRVGVLTEEDVLRSYRDLGYDTDKARVMTDFVMLLNAPKTADDEVALKELSRSNVVGFYSDGLIPRVDALRLLSEMGYTDDASLLYLDASDLDDQRKERKDSIGLIIALAESGVITFEDAEARLYGLGLETLEVDKAIVTLLRKQERKTKLPTRTEAEKMMKTGIISTDEYKELLAVYGYSEKWAEAFTLLATKPS